MRHETRDQRPGVISPVSCLLSLVSLSPCLLSPVSQSDYTPISRMRGRRFPATMDVATKRSSAGATRRRGAQEPAMELGIGLPNTLGGASGELLLAWARRADAGPFASLGVFDRLLYHSFDPLITLAAVAGATSRISLATTIIIGPLRNDALLAKAAATLDALSSGRLTLGLALGARRDDYTAAGVEYAARGQRLDQQLAALRQY